ncbi:carbohydrate ABC transporter permease [Paenibacillus cremeus]|uniref:Sugar ABC transporter permease n=1 Tax=Paenibacillus cremeus TaxID=2163881 RepID=A0A559KC41_9BACL|nr:sugar ABC transporter permease [Paenibacillus cremeus]TVY09687.1 sugar ABC transporter permease [Paenibacillus cremeus]
MIRKLRLNSVLLRKVEGSIFIAPWVIGFLAFIAYPLGYSLYMSFQRVKITASGIEYSPVGLQYYREILLADGGLLYNDLLPFLRQSLVMIPVIVFFSLMVAILLNQKFFGRGFFRVIFFMPVIFSSGQIIQEFITQGEGQLAFVQEFDVGRLITTYLPATWSAPIVKIISSFVLVLWYSGVQILIFLAGRQTISASVYEAARIDGAAPWETFWKITLPGLAPFVFLNLIYTVVDLFTFPSNPIISKVNTQNYGLSSALAWIYFIIVLIFMGLAIWIFSRVAKAAGEKR